MELAILKASSILSYPISNCLELAAGGVKFWTCFWALVQGGPTRIPQRAPITESSLSGTGSVTSGSLCLRRRRSVRMRIGHLAQVGKADSLWHLLGVKEWHDLEFKNSRLCTKCPSQTQTLSEHGAGFWPLYLWPEAMSHASPMVTILWLSPDCCARAGLTHRGSSWTKSKGQRAAAEAFLVNS